MLPYQVIDGGSFTSDASVSRQVIQVSDQPDMIHVRNRSGYASTAAAITASDSFWFKGMAQDSAQTWDKAITTGAVTIPATATTNGFRVYNTQNPPIYSADTISAVTAANPAVVSVDSSTGSVQVGDVVRMINTTGMLQISGYDFEVTALSVDSTITLNIDTQNEAAAATDGEVRLIIPGKMYPRRRFIVPLSGAAGITQATSAVVSTSVAHDFTVGEKVRLKVPSAYGMTEANDQVATVTATSTYTVTLDLDSSGFTAFSLPTSAIYAAGVTPAGIIPAGSGPYPSGNPPYVSTDASYDNRNQWQIVMGSNVITENSDVYDWIAYKYDRFTAL